MSGNAQHLTAPGLAFFVLGAAQVPPSPPLPGPVLVRLLGDLGMAEGVRVALTESLRALAPGVAEYVAALRAGTWRTP